MAGCLSPSAQAGLVRLGARLPFAEAAADLAYFWQVHVNPSTARRQTEAAGAAYNAVQTTAAAALAAAVGEAAPPAPHGPPCQFLSADGAMVPLVGGAWAEVKTLAVGTLRPALTPGTPPQCADLSYYSHPADADTFTRLAVVETHRRGLPTAGIVVAVTDGSAWLQGCIDDHRPDAVRILDFPHAVEHLTAAAQAAFAAGDDQAAIRVTDQAHIPKHGDPRQLRAALDSRPLWGAGRVEDTYNLLGHAVGKALGVIARQQGRGLAEVARDRDWDEPTARDDALRVVLAALDAAEAWLATQPGADDDPAVQAGLAAAREVRAQDVATGTDGAPALRRGVAADRRIGVEDGAMRHGRKSRSRRINGDKRHGRCDVATTPVHAAGVTPANALEARVADAIAADLQRQEVARTELHIDRAYLSSTLVRDRPADLAIYGKAWPVQGGDRFPKTAFAPDWDAGTIRCPTGVTRPFAVGGTVQFPAATCAACPVRDRCTGSAQGRSVAIHPDERLLQELCARQHAPAGRAKLRERVAVEHTLAHVGHWQGDRARYVGQRKNLFDLRRCEVMHNLHLIKRQRAEAPAAAAA